MEFYVFLGAGAGNVAVANADDHLGDPIMQVERAQHGLRSALLGGELRRGLGGGLWRGLGQQSEQREGDDQSHRPLGYLHFGDGISAIGLFAGGTEWQRCGRDLGYVKELWRRGDSLTGCKRVAEHRITKRTGGADDVRARIHQFLSAVVADAFAGFFTEEGKPATGAAAEAALAGSRWIDHHARARQHRARLIIGAAIASEITRIVIHDLVVGIGARQLILMAGHELAVMLDLGRPAEFFPVYGNRTHAMRADGDDLSHFGLIQGFEILFGELLEHQVIAQAAGRIASAFFFFENAEGSSEVRHYARKRRDDFAALRIIGTHAAQPQTVFLSTVEDGKSLLLNKFVALGGTEAERVAITFE